MLKAKAPASIADVFKRVYAKYAQACQRAGWTQLFYPQDKVEKMSDMDKITAIKEMQDTLARLAAR